MKSWRPAPAWQALGWAAAAAVCVAYAFVAHHAASQPRPGLFEAAVFIVPVMAFALLPAWRSPRRVWWLAAWVAACAALWLARDRLGASTQWVLLAQHAGINCLLCLGFGRTLAAGAVPLISRLARIVHGELSPRLVRYTRNATLAWTVFFGVTSLISVALFAWAPAFVWSAFVNLLSMPLLIAMFAGEYLVRMLVIPREERGGFLQAVQAYRQFSRRDSAKPH